MSPTTSTTSPAAPLPVEAPDKEALIERNPHRDFPAVEALRPDYPRDASWTLYKTPVPNWKAGDGASSDHWKGKAFTTIDPADPARTNKQNYKLLTSTTVPRPVMLVSTVTKDGKTRNLAPFSYFQNVCTDPPLYSLACTGIESNDTLQNILDTKECCISMTSDWMVEAMNFTSVNTPRHISEWGLAGLTPHASDVVTPPFVTESPFSAECRLYSSQDLLSIRENKGVRTSTLVLLQVVRWHVWSDAVGPDAMSADLTELRPVFRGGGIMYGTCLQGFELPRPAAFRLLREEEKVKGILDEVERQSKDDGGAEPAANR